MKPIFIQYSQCGTCRKAAKWLKENRIDVEVRDIISQNPTLSEITAWIAKSHVPATKFFNTSGLRYRELNLKDKVKTISTKDLAALLASDGKLIRRPVLVWGDRVLIGFREEEWREVLLPK